MDALLGSLLLILFGYAISSFERYRIGTAITPLGVLIWPYIVIVLLVNLIGQHFGFFPISLKSILMFTMFAGFFALGGHICINYQMRRSDYKNDFFLNRDTEILSIIPIFRSLFIGIGVIAIITGLIHLYQNVQIHGVESIWQSEFRSDYGTGVLSHFMILSRPAFIFLFADYIISKKKSLLILLILLFFIVFARQVKYHIFGLILGGYFFALLHHALQFSIKRILKYVIIIVVLFLSTYYIGFFAVGTDYALSEKTRFWVINLFFTYLFGGPIGFSEILSNNLYPLYSSNEIFAVPINLYRFLVKDINLVDIIIHNWIPVSEHNEIFHSSNVFGMIGMLYMYLGTYGAIIYLFLSGFLFYSIWILAIKFKRWVGIQLVYAFMMCYLTVGFFDLYFNKLTFYEASAYMLIVPLLFNIGKRMLNYAALSIRQTNEAI